MLRRWTVWLCLAVVAGTAAALAWAYSHRPAPRPDVADPFPVPPFSDSPDLTTRPDARHVGVAACKECHASRHRSYLHTSHSRALLSATYRDRNLGLAYRLAVTQVKDRERAVAYHTRARDLLERVYQAGLRDGTTLEALARLYRKEQKFPRARAQAQEALDAQDVPIEARADLLLIQADGMLTDDQPDQAVALLEQVVRIRPNSANWYFLGAVHEKAALQKALSLNPFDARTHTALADVYRKLGDSRRAKEHAQKAEWLSANAKS